MKRDTNDRGIGDRVDEAMSMFGSVAQVISGCEPGRVDMSVLELDYPECNRSRSFGSTQPSQTEVAQPGGISGLKMDSRCSLICESLLHEVMSCSGARPAEVTNVNTPIKSNDIAYPVQMQLEAYNARDIDAFMPWWAENCEYYAFPTNLLARGASAIRERHVERFKEPNLHGKLLTRIVVGNVVVDHETVQRTFPEGHGEVDVICTYEIEDGKITKAWFKMGERRLLLSEV